jgi:hypothetical protein
VADGNLIITAPAASAVTATATSAAGIDMGRVFEGRVNGTASVKLPSWTPGIYLINVSSQAGNATVKAIIR